MNTLLHGYTDAKIKQGDTLDEPLFLSEDKLQKFDIILANPPYSIKKWNQKKWENDAYARNIYGTPPQSKADFAFIEHIVCSLNEKGKAAILLPHGILFRDEEKELRGKMIEDNVIEAIIGLGPNLFYNSPMESCIMILNKNKNSANKNKIFFIDAINENEKFEKKNRLSKQNIKNISELYKNFKSDKKISRLVDIKEIEKHEFELHIRNYIVPTLIVELRKKMVPIDNAIFNWKQSKQQLKMTDSVQDIKNE
jgi:type I restriction enzyme M protein